MGVAVKDPVSEHTPARLEKLVDAFRNWLRRTEAGLPIGEKLRRRLARLYRSKGERYQIAGYYEADFVIDLDTAGLPAWERGSPIHSMAAY